MRLRHTLLLDRCCVAHEWMQNDAALRHQRNRVESRRQMRKIIFQTSGGYFSKHRVESRRHGAINASPSRGFFEEIGWRAAGRGESVIRHAIQMFRMVQTIRRFATPAVTFQSIGWRAVGVVRSMHRPAAVSLRVYGLICSTGARSIALRAFGFLWRCL